MSSFTNREVLVKVGLPGQLYGEEWMEIGNGRLHQILIAHGKAINSIQTVYERNGMIVFSHRHGGDGEKFDCVNLEAWERLVAVRGYYGPVEGEHTGVIRSLTLVTNRANYGPFGREAGTQFCFKLEPGTYFGGFHGRSTPEYLRAIGVYVKNNSKYHFRPDPPRQHYYPYINSP